MMRIIIKLVVVVVVVSGMASCKKYLDVTPDNVATIEYAFRNRNEAENYLFTCYSTLQNSGMGNVVLNPGFTTSGEVIFPFPTPELLIDPAGFNLLRGSQNVIDPELNYWDGRQSGTSLFVAIRRCNIFLQNIDKPIDLDDYEKTRWIAEAKFLKAYYLFWLVRMYGPIPVIRENLPISAPTEEVRVNREPVDSAFNYIVQLLDEAAKDLPEKILNEAAEAGRVTKIIALSVKAKVLVTQASSLYNGNPDYASLKNKDGQALFSATTDMQKWKKAADACKAAIDACHDAGITFYKFIPPANITHLSDSTKLLLTMRSVVTDKWNNEIIWSNNNIFDYQYMCVARLNDEAFLNDGIRSQFSVPIDEAELFYTDHGVPINEDKTWDYANRYSMQTSDSSNRYHIKEGYTTIKMHFNREPRFYADLGFDGGTWFGNGTLDDNNTLYVQAKAKQPAGVRDASRNNITGYFVKKLVNYQSAYLKTSTAVNYPWPMMRLSDLYLLYAEALNEFSGPSETVYHLIDTIRAKAGLKGVVESWKNFSKNPGKPTTKEGLREIIHRERRIELAFEGQAGWDLRRWKELQNVLSDPIQGWNIYEEDAPGYYRPRTIYTPEFGNKDYLWPVRDHDLIVNPKLIQNPGW